MRIILYFIILSLISAYPIDARYAADSITGAPALRPLSTMQQAGLKLHTNESVESLEFMGLLARNAHEYGRFRDSVQSIRKITRPVRVSFIMPMYKEEARLSPMTPANPLGEDALRHAVQGLQLLNRVNPFFQWQIIAVDDGSPGVSSAKCVNKLWEEIKQEYLDSGVVLYSEQVVTLIMSPEEKESQGSIKGGAVLLGLEKAVADNWSEYIGFMDTDRSTHTVQAALLLDRLFRGECDVAIASRYVAGGKTSSSTFFSNISSKVYSKFVHALLPSLKDIHDTQRGFKLFKRKVLNDIIEHAEDVTFSFDTELLLLAKHYGYRIGEVGISWFDSTKETKVSLFSDAPRMIAGLFRQRRRIQGFSHLQQAVDSARHINPHVHIAISAAA